MISAGGQVYVEGTGTDNRKGVSLETISLLLLPGLQQISKDRILIFKGHIVLKAYLIL